MNTTCTAGPGGDHGPGRWLFEFVRHWSRRSTASDAQAVEQGRLVMVTDAVDSITRREPATINAVTREIGIDQSGASRLVKSAVAAGYLQMQASQADGRRRHVTLTPAGLRMLNQAHEWQEAVFARLTEGWSGQQRIDFQRAILSLLERSRTIDS